MITNDAIAEIESSNFEARVNLASSLRHFLRILRDEPAVKSLIRDMKEPLVREVLERRILQLSSASFDKEYAHPHDVALAAYVWLFGIMAWLDAERLAESVVVLPNTWWARKVCSLVLEAAGGASSSTSFQISQEVSGAATGSVYNTSVTSSGGRVISPPSRPMISAASLALAIFLVGARLTTLPSGVGVGSDAHNVSLKWV